MYKGDGTISIGHANEEKGRSKSHGRPKLSRTKFGQESKRLRQQRGYSLGDQAKATGKSMGYISQIETGRKSPTPEYVSLIAAWMKLSSEEFRILKNAADTAIRPIRIVPLTTYQAALASELARLIGKLMPDQCEEVLARLLEAGEKCLDPFSESSGGPQFRFNLPQA
jgi:transcriptional regulator with XRE-family HTH domain